MAISIWEAGATPSSRWRQVLSVWPGSRTVGAFGTRSPSLVLGAAGFQSVGPGALFAKKRRHGEQVFMIIGLLIRRSWFDAFRAHHPDRSGHLSRVSDQSCVSRSRRGPGPRRRLLRVQWRRQAVRCQRTTVSLGTKTTAWRHPTHDRAPRFPLDHRDRRVRYGGHPGRGLGGTSSRTAQA